MYFYILIPILLAITMNIIISNLKWNNNNQNYDLLPSGKVIGTVWIILLALLGYSYYYIHCNSK